jgi:hypothetical protein
MSVLFKKYQIVNILSIDIVAGAVISALFFSKLLLVEVKIYGLVALALTVWIIYTIDHLRDARRIRHPAATLRHRFHQENYRTLLFVLYGAIVIDAAIILFIRRQVFEWGLILSAIVLLYLMIHRSLRFLKELFIASLYTAGILLLSITTTPVQTGLMHYLVILQFGSIAWANLVLFSWFDVAFDQQNEQNSFVTVLGRRTTEILLIELFALNFIIAIIQLSMAAPIMAVFILIAMNSVLLIIFLFRKVLEKHELYRSIGDAIFMLPAFFLI